MIALLIYIVGFMCCFCLVIGVTIYEQKKVLLEDVATAWIAGLFSWIGLLVISIVVLRAYVASDVGKTVLWEMKENKEKK